MKRVELLSRVDVVVEIDPSEPQEDRVRAAELAEELPGTAAQPVVDARQHPAPDDLVGEGWQRRRLGPGTTCRARTRRPPRPCVRSPGRVRRSATTTSSPRSVEHRIGDEHLATVGELLGGGEPIDELAGEEIDLLDVGIPDDEAARLTRDDGDLERQVDDVIADLDPALPSHRALHRHRARRARVDRRRLPAST